MEFLRKFLDQTSFRAETCGGIGQDRWRDLFFSDLFLSRDFSPEMDV